MGVDSTLIVHLYRSSIYLTLILQLNAFCRQHSGWCQGGTAITVSATSITWILISSLHESTGVHTVADIFCVGCGDRLGWFYHKASDQSQKYKEGKPLSVLELSCVVFRRAPEM
jgi:Yippee zinc-binding/DNA-binding /Mis18, centromere assembly